ncbi:MAG TPA: transporter [Sphingomonadaceae bacterium]|nr:transporter [Sphingomonadaceae bacterium]
MTRTILGGAPALLLMAIATPALAEDTENDDLITAMGYRPDAHGPSGVMGDHVHESGEIMIGFEWMHMRHSDMPQSGTDPIADADILAAGYAVRTQSMTMDMAMLHIMYAPNDTLTFMLMPTWNRMEMTMVGIDPMAGMDMDMDGHHSLMLGETMTHSVSGFGDTRLGALVSLSRDRGLAAHAGLSLSIPTGSTSRKNADGTFVHYGMQPGSGTWDIEPSLTLRGIEGGFGWGAQVKHLIRLEDANESGFAFGDRFSANAWLSKPLGSHVSLSLRVGFTSEGAVEGHYNGPHKHASPPDRQDNYGGDVLDAGAGVNFVIGEALRLGAEVNLPLYEDLNGIQLPRDFGLNVSLSKMF